MWESIATDSCDICFSPRSKRSNDSLLDKENIQPPLSLVKNEDISFYGCSSPPSFCTGTSPNHCNHNIIRRPFDDHDPNSHDSGYGNYNDGTKFSFESASIESMEDEFFQEITGIEPLENSTLPKDFNKLIRGNISFLKPDVSNILPKDAVIKPLFSRALSLDIQSASNARKVRSCLFKNGTDVRPFKRSEPPQGFDSPINTKKIKVYHVEDGVAAVPSISRPLLKRHFSANEESIMSALQRSSTEPDLIGDFSKTFCLPLTIGRHQDLKSITPATLARLINGDFNSNVASFKVIDCRYPYEYEGGHIEGAVNLYTREQCMELLTKIECSHNEEHKRSDILVFHCEFSSERGPNLYRYLRKQDRQMNQDTYPSLHYPEVYLLDGGYKYFFEQFSHLCVPIAYKQMLHPEHENDLRYFRLKSKTWNVDTRQKLQACRSNLMKLGL